MNVAILRLLHISFVMTPQAIFITVIRNKIVCNNEIVTYLKKHPFELVLILVLFYAISRSGWSGPGLLSKLTTAALLLALVAMIRFAWEEKTALIRSKILSLIKSSGKQARIKTILIFTLLGVVFTLVEAALELVIFLAWKGHFPVVIGFPYAVYSFSVYRFLYYNIFLDTVLNASILYLISLCLTREEK